MSPENHEPDPEDPTVEIIEVGEQNHRALNFKGMHIFGSIDLDDLAEDLRRPADSDD